MTVIVGPWQNSTQVKDQGYPYYIPIDDLPLSVRPYNCLRWLKVRTVGDLIKKTPHDLLRTQNFGYKSLCEVEECLLAFGITWGRKAGWKRQRV